MLSRKYARRSSCSTEVLEAYSTFYLSVVVFMLLAVTSTVLTVDASPVDFNNVAEATRQRVLEAYDSRIEKMLEGTKTDECRTKLLDSFERNMKAELLEHGPWVHGEDNLLLSHRFKNECKTKTKIPKPTTPSDPEKIGIFYHILAHSKPDQVAELVDKLQHPNHVFAVHFDAKCDPLVLQRFGELLSARREDPARYNFHDNVIIQEKRAVILWGGWGMLEATRGGFEIMLAMLDDTEDSRGQNLDFYINLSETSYPLRSDYSIRLSLASFDPDWNVMGMKKQENDGRTHPNVLFYYEQCDSKLFRTGHIPTPFGISSYVGSQWVLLSPKFIRWVLHSNQAEKYREYFSHYRIPDEVYLQTMLKHSPYCNSQIHDDTHLFRWEKNVKKGDTSRCISADPRSCGRSARALVMADLPALQAAHNIFVRKVDTKVDVELIRHLDKLREGALEYKDQNGIDCKCHAVSHVDTDCWEACGNKGGKCPGWCGKDGACCRDGWQGDPVECGGRGGISRHSCICDQRLPDCGDKTPKPNHRARRRAFARIDL